MRSTGVQKYAKLTTLINRVNEDSLKEAHKHQKTGKAVGIDGMTKEEYERNLDRLYHISGGITMSRQGDFLIYCTEQYKSVKKLNGKQVSELFSAYKVWDYIYSCFEALHTTGANYIVEDIDSYIEARKTV